MTELFNTPAARGQVGNTPQGAGEKTNSPAFLYVYKLHDKHKRKGAKCRVVEYKHQIVRVQFEDGVEVLTPRTAIRRSREHKNSVLLGREAKGLSNTNQSQR